MSEPGDEIPQARVRAHLWFAWVWAVPITAAAIVAWLAFRSIASHGPVITIAFRAAEGLEAHQSRIQHRGVTVGTVEQLELAPDMSRVIVHARMSRSVAAALNENTRFYVVSPRVSIQGISGLSTLVSGSYIEMLPGKGSQPRRHFVGLSEAPVLRADVPGQTFRIMASDLGSLTRGSPISYHGVTVGEVESYRIAPDGAHIEIAAFIRAPYDRLVQPETRFWNGGGVDIAIGPQGVRIRASSWQQLLSGGLAFDTPEPARARPSSAAGTTFTLYDSRRAAMRDPRGEQLLYVADFAGNLRGVDAGTPVELEGMEIGEVRDARLSYDAHRRTLATFVTIGIDPARLQVLNLPRADGSAVQRSPQEWIETLVAHGLRAQVTSANLITGFKIVSLKMVHGASPPRVKHVGEYVQLPTEASEDLEQILQSLHDVLQNLDTATSGPELAHAIKSLDRTLTHLDQITNDVQPDLQTLIESLRATSEAAQTTLTSVNGLLGQNGAASPDLAELMQQLTHAARSVRGLADYLDRHPEAIWRGRREAQE